MSQITTHILDTSRGKPAAGVRLALRRYADGKWSELAAGVTDADGRVSDLLKDGEALPAGEYQIAFETGAYYGDAPCFYPRVEITFRIEGDGQHYHVPLLLNPFGYSTYRGS
ncbi:MAG: hydroxyisourate hydrolase [Gammaproteobacteria bacterium]|nr:hydroxyisourate hydrolase [Gammaproteobacteria bacterium]CAJ2375811.1 MAG: 5-hydroxyisourate hydrolase [Arenicellales bacterium IbO2]MDA7962812.1 hydroxyisourate hydrolase [Gammaproteobacteria bacterium]MDA7967941.1 hydroxyisourate hydrolase [Gammaproteobacteria bacterium]MDA7969931.1 hydroxyisourate hydrolase [Gammaproteobacteria bacterium]